MLNKHRNHEADLICHTEQKAFSDTGHLRNTAFVLKDGAHQNAGRKAELPQQHYSDLVGQPKNRGSVPFGVFVKASRSTGVTSFLLSLGTAELFSGENSQEAHNRSVQLCTARAYSRCGAPVNGSHKFTLTLNSPEITSSVS